MSAAPVEPQGILFARNSCAGQSAAPVRNVVASVRVRVNDRPRLLEARPVRGFFGRVFAGRTGCHGTAAATGYGCAGGVSASANVQVGLPMPAAEAPSVATPPTMEGPVRRLIVRNQLRKALESSNSPAARKALEDGDVFEATVAKVHRDMSRRVMAASDGQPVGAFGDGRIFKLIMDNLPAILDAVERIIKLFS